MTTITKSPTSLSNLAPELLIQTFKSAEDFSTVTSLSGTCRHFRDIWKTNTSSICDAVLHRVSLCPKQAIELLNTRQKLLHRCDPCCSMRQHRLTHNAAILGIANILYYQKSGLRDLPQFERFEQCQRAIREMPWGNSLMGPDRFLRACYRALIINIYPVKRLPREFLRSLSITDMRQMQQVLYWFAADSPSTYTIFQNAALGTRRRETHDIWSLLARLGFLMEDLTILSEAWKADHLESRDLPSSMDKGYCEESEISLADLLPLLSSLPNKSPCYELDDGQETDNPQEDLSESGGRLVS